MLLVIGLPIITFLFAKEMICRFKLYLIFEISLIFESFIKLATASKL
jgi:hypothetical protein